MKANWRRHHTIIKLHEVRNNLTSAIQGTVQANLNGSLSEDECTDLYKRIDGHKERETFDLLEYYIEREMKRIVEEIEND